MHCGTQRARPMAVRLWRCRWSLHLTAYWYYCILARASCKTARQGTYGIANTVISMIPDSAYIGINIVTVPIACSKRCAARALFEQRTCSASGT
eukprot:6175235-Pleurochrysis_carterae.AAC.1